MKSVVFCEGGDDMWFLAYYLNHADGWNTRDGDKMWQTYKLLPTSTVPDVKRRHQQEVLYMISKDEENTVAVFSVDGQDKMEAAVHKVLKINNDNPNDQITSLIMLRDSDDRDQEVLAEEMGHWFSSELTLRNNEVTDFEFYNEIEEENAMLQLLAIVVPFDEHGAIETLLSKVISDTGDVGRHIVDSAKTYVDDMKQYFFEYEKIHGKKNKPKYLRKQREVTKAKFSAAIAITNPDHSADGFRAIIESDMMKWEDSPSIIRHMEKVVSLIGGKMEPMRM